MKNSFFNIIIVILLALMPVISSAEDNDGMKFARKYGIFWTGVHIADLWVEVEENSMHAVIDSYGVVKKVSKYYSDSKSKFIIKDGGYIPQDFTSKFTQRQGDKEIRIKYNENGDVIEESVTPPDKRGKRPEVANNLKKNTVDPLTLAVAAKEKIRAAISGGNKEFSIVMYDARRLARYDFTVEDGVIHKIKGKETIKVSFRRKPIAGFTKNELNRMKGEEPEFTVYVESESILPVKMEAVAPLGSAIFVLDKECGSMKECGK